MSSQRLTESPSDTTHSTADTPQVERDDAFHLLSNGRRRAVMRHLLAAEEPSELGHLAEHVAAIENDCDPDRLSSDDRKRVYISLYQGHMPKLDKHGLVEYDQARGTVEPKPLLEAFAPFLDETPLSLDEANGLTDDSERTGFTTAISSIFGR